MVYSLRVSENEPLVLDDGQSMKIYLNNDSPQFMKYGFTMRGESPIGITTRVINGCANIYARARLEEADRLIALNVTSEQGDVVNKLSISDDLRLCKNEGAPNYCNMMLYARSCNDKNALLYVTADVLDRELILDNEENILLLPNTTRRYSISNLSPITEMLEIVIKQRKTDDERVRGMIKVEQVANGLNVTESIKSNKKKIIVTLNAKSGDLSEDYTVEINSTEELNVVIKANTYSVINDHLRKIQIIHSGVIANLKKYKIMKMNKEVQAAFFTYYLPHREDNGVAIVATPLIELKNFKVHASMKPWPSDDDDMWSGNIIKPPNQNYWYYFVVDADINNSDVAGSVHFTVLDVKNYMILEVGKEYDFEGTRLYRFKIRDVSTYMLTKTGKTNVYLSIEPSVKLPKADNCHYLLTPEDSKIEILPLEGTDELYFTVYCHIVHCPYKILIEERPYENLKSDL